MTREEIARVLFDVERALSDRVSIVRVIVDEQGHETGQRIYCGSFQAPPGWQTREPEHQGEKT